MLTEYEGPHVLALWHEMRTLSAKANIYRTYYEIARHAGLTKKYYNPKPIDDAELFKALGGKFKNPESLLNHLRTRNVPFFFNWKARKAYSEILNTRFANDRSRCIELADAICEHRFNLMGTQVQFGEVIDWHRLLDVEWSWDKKHWTTINYRCPNAPGDVKTTWELNRHQFWLDLGRAYWYTGDEKYPAEWARQLWSWIDQNPVETGVNWMSNLEHAIRVISWTWALNFFLDSRSITPELVFEIYRIILAKGRHLRKDIFYSLHVQYTNHLVGDCLGLIFAGFCYPEFDEAKKWSNYAFHILVKYFPRVIWPDGVSSDVALSYHRFALYFYILANLLHKANSGTDVKILSNGIEKVINVIQALTKPDGSVSLFGDNDNGRAIVLSNGGPLDYQPTLSTGAVLYKRGDLKYTAAKLSQETFWLMGSEAIRQWDSIESHVPTKKVFSFPVGGIYVCRSGWDRNSDYAMIKCGPFVNHREADLGHVDISVCGQNLLIDPGTYTYNGPWKWRRYFRSTQAHNTVSVDGKSQALTQRSFRFIFTPNHIGSSASFTDKVKVIEVRHRSFRFLRRGGIRHKRLLIIVEKEYWIVVDHFTGGRHSHLFRQHWNFDPSVKVAVIEDNRAKAELCDGRQVCFVPLGHDKINADSVIGQEYPIQGWATYGFGIKTPSPMLTYEWQAQLPTSFATAIVPGQALNTTTVAFRQAIVTDDRGRPLPPEKALGFVLTLGNHQDVLAVAQQVKAPLHIKGKTFSGGTAYFQEFRKT